MRQRAVTALASIILAMHSGKAVAATYQKIAVSGDAAPGAPAGTTFVNFDMPYIDAASDVLFRATDSTQRNGIWIEKNGTLQKVIRYGDTPPGRPGTTFTTIDQSLAMNAAGQMLFRASWTGDYGIWTGKPGSLAIAVAESSPVPGMSGLRFGSLDSLIPPVLDSAGEIAFYTELATGNLTNDTAIWKWSSGSLSQIIREGDAAPGTQAGVTFGDLFIPSNSNSPRIANGKVAVYAFLTGSGVTSDNDRGIWLGDGQTLSKIVREGDLAPGGEQFKEVAFDSTSRGKIAISDVGDVIFQSKLASGRQGIYRWRNGIIDPVVKTGDPAPSTGGTFLNISTPLVTASGSVAFWADLQSGASTRGSLWTWSDGVLKNIVTSTDKPSEMPHGFEFFRLGGTNQVEDALFLNDKGQIAFGSGLNSPNLSTSTLWSYDAGSGLHMLAGPNQTLQVAAGDVRTFLPLTSLNFLDGKTLDGRFNSLNDSGDLAVKVLFNIGSGVVTTNVAPEPSGVLLIVLGGVLHFRRRR